MLNHRTVQKVPKESTRTVRAREHHEGLRYSSHFPSSSEVLFCFIFISTLVPGMLIQLLTSGALAFVRGVKLVGGHILLPNLPGDKLHTCPCYSKALFAF